MNTPLKSPKLPDDEMEVAAKALKLQAASARAAGAKHRARLMDQLRSQGPDASIETDSTEPAVRG